MTSNGNNFIQWKWLVGVLIAAIMTLIGSAWATLSSRVYSIEQAHVEGNKLLSSVKQENAVLSVTIKNTNENLEKLTKSVERVENYLIPAKIKQ